jgi:uncharacterized membrane protein (UPF0127 family)
MTNKAPMRLTATNIDTGKLVASRVRVATRTMERAIGLLCERRLDPGQGLLITPCRGVHTWGMRFTIDLLALTEDGVVVDAVERLSPWRIRLPRRGGINILELPEGSVSRTKTQLGHHIALKLAPAWEGR